MPNSNNGSDNEPKHYDSLQTNLKKEIKKRENRKNSPESQLRNALIHANLELIKIKPEEYNAKVFDPIHIDRFIKEEASQNRISEHLSKKLDPSYFTTIVSNLRNPRSR